MKSSENHYSFIRSGRNGSLLLIFNILGIEPSSHFIFGKVEGWYWDAVIELKRGFAKNKTLQMSHMIKKEAAINIRCLKGAEPPITSQSVDLLYFFWPFWPGEWHSGGWYNEVLVLLQIGFTGCSCLPTGSVGFFQSFGWWPISRLYFNFLNQSAKISQPLTLLFVRNDKWFNGRATVSCPALWFPVLISIDRDRR